MIALTMCVFLVGGGGFAIADSQPSVENPIFYAMQVKGEHIRGTLRLNDVPLGQWNSTQAPAEIQLINQWITGDINQVSVILDWLEAGDTRSARLEINIFSTMSPDQSSEKGLRIAEFRWPQVANTNERSPRLVFQFRAKSPPAQLWKSADTITLNATTRHEAFALLGQLQLALVGRNSAKAAALLDWKTVDMAHSMYMDAAMSRDSLKDFLGFFFSRPRFTMLPLDEQQLEFQLAADERLLWISRGHGAGALQSVGSPQLDMSVYLARINGQWCIVR